MKKGTGEFCTTKFMTQYQNNTINASKMHIVKLKGSMVGAYRADHVQEWPSQEMHIVFYISNILFHNVKKYTAEVKEF